MTRNPPIFAQWWRSLVCREPAELEGLLAILLASRHSDTDESRFGTLSVIEQS